MSDHQEPYVTATKTPSGWKIEMDNAAWVQLLNALTIALSSEARDGNQPNAMLLRRLRTALSRATRTEG